MLRFASLSYCHSLPTNRDSPQLSQRSVCAQDLAETADGRLAELASKQAARKQVNHMKREAQRVFRFLFDAHEALQRRIAFHCNNQSFQSHAGEMGLVQPANEGKEKDCQNRHLYGLSPCFYRPCSHPSLFLSSLTRES